MEKEEILAWVERHDKKNFWWIQQEKEIGDFLRKTKILTRDDLIKIMEWKFASDHRLQSIQVKYAKLVTEQHLNKISSEVFNLGVNQDLRRINLLCLFKGIGPAVASVILTFYDPENYCVGDFHIYQELFGFRPKVLTSDMYLKILNKLRAEARKHNLRTRDVEKAYFIKNCETTPCKKIPSGPLKRSKRPPMS